MTDHLDNQTNSLNEKPKRGRPATGKAMTAAEKQKAYRDRKKAEQDYFKSSAEAYDSLQDHYDWLYNDRERILKIAMELEQENKELKSSNVTEIKFVIRTRSKGKRKWDEKEKEILWDSMEEAVETVKILQKENEKRGWGFEYRIEPAPEFINNFVREFK